MGIPSMAVGHLLAVPIDSPWMTAGHAPPTAFPRHRKDEARADGTRQMTAVTATRDGTGWQLQLDAGHQSTRRTSLVHAEKLARDLVGNTEVVLCPLLPEGIDALLRASALIHRLVGGRGGS